MTTRGSIEEVRASFHCRATVQTGYKKGPTVD